jgi:hypothetical protein
MCPRPAPPKRNFLSTNAVECYGATRTQVGHGANEDAFIIGRDPVPYAAVFDGAWAPFVNMQLLRKVTMAALFAHFSEVPHSILDAASPPDGPPDDMTVIALRLRRQVSRSKL